MVCLSADQLAENHLESNGVDVKRSKLEARSGILTWKWILEYPDQLWNHVEMMECRQQRHRWKFPTLPPPAPPTRTREASLQQQRRRRCGGQDEDGDLRPILHESFENEGDWLSRPLHKNSRNAFSRAAERGRQIDRRWPHHHYRYSRTTSTRRWYCGENMSFPWTSTSLL